MTLSTSGENISGSPRTPWAEIATFTKSTPRARYLRISWRTSSGRIARRLVPTFSSQVAVDPLLNKGRDSGAPRTQEKLTEWTVKADDVSRHQHAAADLLTRIDPIPGSQQWLERTPRSHGPW